MSSTPPDDASIDRSDFVDDNGSSDDILVEDMRSGLRTVEVITEQLSVEDASISVIDLISKAERAVKSVVETPAPRKIRLSTGSNSSKELNKEAKTTLALLDDTIRQVQELHVATIQRQVKRSVTLGALEYLRTIEIAVKELLQRLPGNSASSQTLAEFAERAGKWIRSSGNDASRVLSSTLSPNVKLSKSILSGSSNSSSVAFVKSDGDSCPLETAMRSANIFGRLTNNLDGFIEWALREKHFSDVHSQVGSVQSVHLFREREAPLHHEFALISLGGGEVKPSWMRVERAALLKARKFMPKWDSFGPIFQGAPLRESISVGASRSELCGKAEELASVLVRGEKPASQFYLDELAKQLSNTSESRPQYQLLTANCRWFARSTLLNSAQRFSQTPVVVYSWHGSDVSFADIHAKLLGDRFGGKQLEGPRAELLAVSNRLEDLAKQLIDAKPKKVLRSIEQVIDLLDPIDEQSTRKQYLIAYAFLLRGTALRMLNHFSAALPSLEKARDLLQPLRSESNDYELLYLDAISGIAYVAYLQKNFEKARVLRLEVVNAWRKQRKLYVDIDSALGLCRALGFYARTLPSLRSEERNAEADRVIGEAVSLAQGTHDQRDDLAAETLAWVLSQQSAILADRHDNEEAFVAASASIEHTRDLYFQRPDMMRRSLACRLLVLSTIASRLDKWDEACEAMRECVEMYRVLYGASPRSFCVDLESRISGLVKVLRRASLDIGTQAVVTLQKVIKSLRMVHKAESTDVHRQVLLFALQTWAYLLGKTQCEPVKALGARDELRAQVLVEISSLGAEYTGKPKVGTGLLGM